LTFTTLDREHVASACRAVIQKAIAFLVHEMREIDYRERIRAGNADAFTGLHAPQRLPGHERRQRTLQP